MTALISPPAPQRRPPALPPTVTLALWRLRQVWRLWLVTGLGMVTAVLLVCMAPLYSQVAMTIGLRDTLLAAPNNNELTVLSFADGLSTPFFAREEGRLATFMQRHLGEYLASAPPQFILEFQGNDIHSP